MRDPDPPTTEPAATMASPYRNHELDRSWDPDC